MKTFGIQGGKGSFNEQALADYTQRHQVGTFKTIYLYTTENVLTALDQGQIDFGQFALHNSVGGLVQESLEAISKHNFRIIEEFGIVIRHCLMKLKTVSSEKITTLMSHPQVFKQCRQTLKDKYPGYRQISGKGELIDHARASEQLALGQLKPEIAILGPKILARIYNLEVVAENLQDNPHNVTTFLMVKKRYT